MADNKHDRPDRKRGPRPGGPRPFAKRGEGKPGFAGRPHAAGGKKPFVKRSDDSGGESRPKRDFKAGGGEGRNFKPRDGERKAGEFKPRSPGSFAKRADGPRDEARERPKRDFKPRDGERKAGEFKPRSPGSFAKRADGPRDEARERPKRDFKPRDGERKAGEFKPRSPRPFTKRAEGPGHETGERPKRDFKPRDSERGPRDSGDRPARPFKNRPERGEASGERPPRAFANAARHDGDRKPFVKRAEPGGGDRPFKTRDDSGHGPRPGRRERSAETASDAPREGRVFKRSTGPGGKSFDGQRGERSPRPRPVAQEAEGASTQERIAKRLARAGIASRRDAEALITDGRVRVNGVVLSSPAFNVSASDRIELDGVEIPPVERTRLFLFHKPAGVVTTNRDPEGRKTIFDVLPQDLPRLVTIGRLDINTEGLLLLTNDGGLARLLELPATGWLRRYRVRVHGKVEESTLADLRDGVAVDGVFYGSIEASLDREQGSNAWLTIGLREGKNREVKNILGSLGLDVTRLIRISYGPFQLGELPDGAVQELKGRMLREQLGERLIEEAGANFDAPIVTPFSNRPVGGKEEAAPEHAERPKIVRDGIRGKIGEGGLIKQRRRDRSEERMSSLSRLTTRPDAGRPKGGKGNKPFAKRGEKPDDRPEPGRGRTTNVWMAPGARPQSKKDGGALSPLEGEKAAKRPEGVFKGRAKRKEKPSTAETTPPGRSAATLPSRGRGGDAPRGKGKGNADRRR